MPPMKRMPTVMRSGHQFSMVPSMSTQRSVFDRSHGYKSTFDAGLLIPVLVDEVLPGDTFTLKMNAFARLTTPLKPFMDNLYLESFFFFVPYRLVWSNFVKFMGEQVNPGDSIAYIVPKVTAPAGGYNPGTLGDYFGLPTAGQITPAAAWTHSALPYRAYRLIYNQWFRDQNLINSVSVPLDDGPDTYGHETPYKRGKRHDYFTACLPFLQKGTAVAMPLGTSAPIRATSAAGSIVSVLQNTGSTYDTLQAMAVNTDISHDVFGAAGAASNRLWADLSGATSATINDMRTAIGVQQFLERDARGGTRYTELVYSHFRVKSPDARLQRAEYLGGGSTLVSVAPIAQHTQTGLTGGTTPIGTLSGVGAAFASGHGFTKSFTEHGVIIGLVNVRADLTYSQGMERMWSRSTRYDFFWPVLEELGEQAVLNKEIYMIGGAGAQDTNVFGYQERYAEYRYKPSKVTGLFRPTTAGTLQIWHLSEKFTTLPTLGQTFIEDQTETVLDDRVAVPSEPDFLLDTFFDLKCARPMRVFGVPGLKRF